MVYLMTLYYKGYYRTGKAKVIYWYMLREVGKLLV